MIQVTHNEESEQKVLYPKLQIFNNSTISSRYCKSTYKKRKRVVFQPYYAYS